MSLEAYSLPLLGSNVLKPKKAKRPFGFYPADSCKVLSVLFGFKTIKRSENVPYNNPARTWTQRRKNMHILSDLAN